MKAECINNNGCEGTLKIGNKYMVQAEYEEKYKIELKKGETGIYLKGRFKVIEE